MNYFISGKLAAAIDKHTINDIGIPSIVLMERAAFAVVEETVKFYDSDIKTGDIVIFCGKGNNGADGLAVSRILFQKGYNVKVIIAGEPDRVTEEFALQSDILKKLGVKISILRKMEDVFKLNFDNCSLIIDGLFGIGLTREITGLNYELIKRINDEKKKVISIDIASGLDSLKGLEMGIAINADITVTFGYPKAGHIICNGKKYTGRLIVHDIGFCVPENFEFNEIDDLSKHLFEGIKDNELVKLPKRTKISNKGTYKNINIIGAGENMSGAVALAGEAAYRCGCGLVKIFASENNINPLKCLIKEAVICGYDKLDIEKFDIDKDIIIVGPGLSVSRQAEEILGIVLKSDCKKIIDADALNIISRNKILLENFDENTIITPHIKEMSRLIDKDVSYIRENIIECAKEFSKRYKCITIIKDATSVVASCDGKVRINATGNSGMSKGGSGDVLTGIIAGMLSQGMNSYEGACLGVCLHGLAGDIASRELSEYGMVASDIISALPKIFLNISDK